jgi:hypothetical protein
MPHPSKLFKQCYQKQSVELSLAQANKRFLSERKTYPELTPEMFFSNKIFFRRLREQKQTVLVNLGGKHFSAPEIYKKLKVKFSKLNEIVSKDSFVRHLQSLNQSIIHAKTLEEFLPFLERRKSTGSANARFTPILTTIDAVEKSFNNSIQLYEALRNCQIKKREFGKRISRLKIDRQVKDEILVLSEDDILDLCTWRGQKDSLKEFARKISSHIQKFGGKLKSIEGHRFTGSFEEAYFWYRNQRTKVEFTCGTDKEHGPYSRDFSHMGSKGCPACSEIQRVLKRKKPYEQAKADVERSNFSLITGKHEYETKFNSRSHLRVKCNDCHHVDKRKTTQSFCHGNIPAKCSRCGARWLGQAMSMMALEHLMGVSIRTEYPIRALGPGGKPLRFDGYGQMTIGRQQLRIGIEHQGHQRKNPKHPVNNRNKGIAAKKQMADRAVSDRMKFAYCDRLVHIPDLYFNSNRKMIVAAEIVIKCLEAEVPELLRSRAYLTRRAEFLANPDLMLPPGKVKTMMNRANAAITATGDIHLAVLGANPLTGKLKIFCRKHNFEYYPTLGNLLGRADDPASGTRCKHCADEERGIRARRTMKEIEESAAKNNVKPDFSFEEYEPNAAYLPWVCLTHPGEKFTERMDRLDRGCAKCRAERDRRRRWNQVKDKLEAEGYEIDEILSPPEDYANQTIVIHYKSKLTGAAFKQPGKDILNKTLVPNSDKFAGLKAHAGRVRLQGYIKLKAVLAKAGFHLLTPESEYVNGNSKVKYNCQHNKRPRQRLARSIMDQGIAHRCPARQ